MKSLLWELKCLYVPLLESENLEDLPDNISKRKKYLTLNIAGDDETKLEPLIDQLECTAWKWHRSSKLGYEVLICLVTLSIFDFSLEDFSFGHILGEKEIDKLLVMLRGNFEELKTSKKTKNKQALALNIALNNPFNTNKVVQFILQKIPDKISSRFSNCTVHNFDPIQLQKDVTRILTRNDNEKILEEKQKSLSIHFNSIFSRKFKGSENQMEEKKLVEVRENVRGLLEDLGLTQYYPQKLTYDDVITITKDALTDVHQKPSTLPELPWYFMRRLKGLNSNIREKGSTVGKGNVTDSIPAEVENDDEISFSWDEDFDDEDDEEVEDTGQKKPKAKHVGEKEINGNVMDSVHPLDLIYIIFLCADDFLRQELAYKMSKCQYAVPFILPSVKKNTENPQCTVLHWGLQRISRTYSEGNNRIVTKTLLKVDCPHVNYISLGTNTPWKSRLLNKMLSPHQDSFWHKGLEGGKRTQKASESMVEVSWYLPAGKGNDEFKTPVTFMNLRGDAQQYSLLTERIIKSSTTTCIFTNEVNKDVLSFLEKRVGKTCLRKIILVILCEADKEKKVVKWCDMLHKKLKLLNYQIIKCPVDESSFHATYDSIRSSLKTSFERNIGGYTSLSRLIDEVKLNGCAEVDDIACHEGFNAAQRILSDIDAIELDDAKSKILPCQSDLPTRELIGKHEKEVCRQKNIPESDLITQYVKKEKEEKWKLQWKQLQYSISDTFTQFLRCVTNYDSINRKYFLQSLKLGLNERSVELLQPLYEDYEKYRLEEKSLETDRKLRELNEQLTYSSLGLEHFFHEMAVMYENMAALSKKLGSKEEYQLAGVLDRLSKVMADILLNGEAMEIVDGDVLHSPVLWLNAVLNQIENSEKVRVFKVSALGAQSSGKSTLLNAAFGLNFPVSSGRCTRGAYMQLVKIDEQIGKRFKCDYLLVIDSKGLMSRVSKNEDFDNELATFVIGLSDLTLVVIKGEGNEMQDVLPIAIHVFLRMNVLGELQACYFVHQNIGAVDVKKTIPVEIDTFVQLLDEKTRAAAQEALKKKYTRFTDVLHYDKNKDNTYVCGLWDGTPPMGKTEIEYSETMQRLKRNVLERLESVVQRKQCSTLEDFSKWLVVIWEAIKYENFVFSFRNVLAVEAYKRLSRILNDKEWNIKKTTRETMDKTKKEFRDKLMTEKDNNRVMKAIDIIKDKVLEDTRHLSQRLWTCICHYFDCPGCQENDYSEEVRNRQFLRDYKGYFQHDILRFMNTLEEEISQSTKSFAVELSSHRDSVIMDGILKQKV